MQLNLECKSKCAIILHIVSRHKSQDGCIVNKEYFKF